MAEGGENFAVKSGLVLDPEKCSKLTLGEKRKLVNDVAQLPEEAPIILTAFTRRELLEIICAEMGKERKYTGMSKGRMINQLLNVINNRNKQNTYNRVDAPVIPVKSQPVAKRQKKIENLNQVSDILNPISRNDCVDEQVKLLLCKNLACRATLRRGDGYCRRCSCCMCHCYDDNKDPSLWLTCNSDPPFESDSCGRSCHLKCALKHERAGTSKNNSFKKLDGQFCCIPCGKISDLLSTWRKQLVIAKEARRVDVLCLRISLSLKILDGTNQYKDLHKVVDTAAKKLKKELGPLDRVCAKMDRGIVNRLACGAEVQKLCTTALEIYHNSNPYIQPEPQNKSPTCKIHFADSYSTSVTIALEYEENLFEDLVGWRIWHRESSLKSYLDIPTSIVLKPAKKVKISELKPSTEYMCRVSLFSSTENFGTWEAKWVTSASNESASDSDDKHHTSNFVMTNHGHLQLNLDPPATVNMAARVHWPERLGSLEDINSNNCGVLLPFVNLTSIPTTPSKVDGKLGYYGLTRQSEGIDFDYCVRAIKALECEGHISVEFRVKFLTWYSLKATKQDRRIVSAFVGAMGNDPPSLAEQLIDTFGDEICWESRALH